MNSFRAYLREFAGHARRTAAAPDNELATHLDLLARQLGQITAIRDRLVGTGLGRVGSVQSERATASEGGGGGVTERPAITWRAKEAE